MFHKICIASREMLGILITVAKRPIHTVLTESFVSVLTAGINRLHFLHQSSRAGSLCVAHSVAEVLCSLCSIISAGDGGGCVSVVVVVVVVGGFLSK